ncbi:uncharacterized protein H6S33_000344 [Morchella sextelata]|uniref:uncharacterized protein n=1 Tax=Morchella sextelata TaxID=1174677 RepID=UPI001D04DB52|nr:uncharacterized protein H6S33_000344 [Morchella sextelata]KAH0614708.1 hypothetical protein H6S33_000344 [Morchella sextelata]
MSSSDSVTASTGPIVNNNENLVQALAEAINDQAPRQQAACDNAAEACDKAPEACCKQANEAEAAKPIKESDEEVKSDGDSCVKSAELCTKEPEACCMKTVEEEAKDASTKATDEAVTVTPAVDGAAEVEIQAGNEATASPAAEEKKEEAKELPPAYVEEKAVEAANGEAVAAIQKIEDLAISEEEDKSVKEVPASDEFADSDINFPFKFEEVKQVTETTGGTPVEVEKTEKVAENGGCCSSCH